MQDWTRFAALAELMLSGSAGEFWHAYDARPETVKAGLLDRYGLRDVVVKALDAAQQDGGCACLSFHFEDSWFHDQMEELWMRALSAEAPDEQVHMLNKYQQYVLNEEPTYCLVAPEAVLNGLVESVIDLADGESLIIGYDDGVVARCPDRQDLPQSGDDAPLRHCWLVSRHGEVVLIDSTFLICEIYVSRSALLTALDPR